MTEEEIQKAIFDVMYESTSSIISSHLIRSDVITEATERLNGVDENEVEYQLTVLEEDWLIKRDGQSVQWGWKGLERYQELGGETNLDEDLQQRILETLLEEKKNDPNHPYVGKEELINRVGESEETVTENVWIQREVGNVELRQALGSDYVSVAITSSGRRTVEGEEQPRAASREEIRAEIEEEIRTAIDDEVEEEIETEPETSETSESQVDDAFICHASEDKEAFVDELAHELRSEGLDVWYDDFRLEIGDSIRQSIDRGLANSRYGIVVLSEHFFEKDWPQRELDALAEKEVGDEKVILPVWFEVDREYISQYSPQLAGRYAGMATEENVSEVADQLRAVIED